jgi:alpha-L-fucosidase
VLWNDYGYPDDADIATLFREYLTRVPDGVINNRFDGDPFGVSDEPSAVYSDFVTPEYTVDGSPELKWEACRGIGTSFGYNREESEHSYMSAAKLIHTFVDIVARGGNMLINVGPMATGAIPWLQAQRLLELGWWLRVNGEAIYDTRPWQRAAGATGEGIGLRYTASADAVHAIVLGAPTGAAIELDVRLADGAVASVHGIDAELSWSAVPTGTRIELPEPPDGDQPAMSVRLSPATAVTPFTET